MLILIGGYLFTITVAHILPDVYHLFAHNPLKGGSYIIIGFFMQLILEFFSKGVEHGHIYDQDKVNKIPVVGLIIALLLHTLLDGSLISIHEYAAHNVHAHHMLSNHPAHQHNGLFIGILFHNIAVAFALVMLLQSIKKSFQIILICLTLFALSCPLGIVLTNYYQSSFSNVQGNLLVLFGIASGSMLHISSTIFFEYGDEHEVSIQKICISLLGSLLAFLTFLL